MQDGNQDDVQSPAGAQRRIRRSPLLFTTPLALLALLTAILLWEVIRANMADGARSTWPWRLHLLDMDALGSLLAVAGGAVLARAQYARTVRPYLGWRGSWQKGHLKGDASGWRVGVLNGGQHLAVVDAWDCRLVLAGQADSASARWGDVDAAVAELTAAGLVVAQDFQIIHFGPGFPLVSTGGYDTVLVGAFSKRFVRDVEALYIRLRVTDVVGDTHERILDCMKGARTDLSAPLD
ncbi:MULTISPECIES: hypothetical protein [unclassified Streptomyces]|uniref:hypothetical protein n=1 Tax=unclassified Streptomyces TaxID=2593676 RepID=UPI002DDB13AD|nr:hypothetical protein [Streptomyces sp. NBC_01761]WSC56776.1 hypothetical protein OG808_33505 [Streptomyces sp. NBC_01761]WSF87618.1 hypothetical protein OIE70_33625 [Streptomyces sp. NBC_01744]